MADEQTPGFTPNPAHYPQTEAGMNKMTLDARNRERNQWKPYRSKVMLSWIVRSERNEVCEIYDAEVGGEATARQFARLIASSKELLEACELAEQTLSGIPVAQTDITVLMNRIRAAIKKARGR